MWYRYIYACSVTLCHNRGFLCDVNFLGWTECNFSYNIAQAAVRPYPAHLWGNVPKSKLYTLTVKTPLHKIQKYIPESILCSYYIPMHGPLTLAYSLTEQTESQPCVWIYSHRLKHNYVGWGRMGWYRCLGGIDLRDLSGALLGVVYYNILHYLKIW